MEARACTFRTNCEFAQSEERDEAERDTPPSEAEGDTLPSSAEQDAAAAAASGSTPAAAASSSSLIRSHTLVASGLIH